MHVRRAMNSEDMAACLRIRRLVFIDEQGVPEAEDLDGLDPVCRHFLALPETASPATGAFGTARILLLDDGTAKAQRVAVLKEMRRHGAGEALMQALEGEAAREGRGVMILGAQLSALPFYTEIGYEAYGEVFIDAGIEHRMMRKSIR